MYAWRCGNKAIDASGLSDVQSSRSEALGGRATQP